MQLRPRRLLLALQGRLERLRPNAGRATQAGLRAESAATARDVYRRLGAAVWGVEKRDGCLEPLASNDEPISPQELGRYLADLQRQVQDVFAPFDVGPEAEREVSATCAQGRCSLDVGGQVPVPLYLAIENRGTAPIGAIGIAVNGEDLSSRESLLRLALDGATTPAGRAHAIQRFVRERRQHGPPPTLSRDDPAAADPLSFFNAFGYGLCGNAANAFVALAHAAGLKARVWNIGGHTLPEVEVEGGWRAFDPDAGAWYLEGGMGGEPLSLARLAGRPQEVLAPLHLDEIWESRREFLAERLADRKAHQQVATGEALEALQLPSDRFAYALAPGERLELFYQATGPWAIHENVLPAPWSPPVECAYARSTRDLLRPGALEGTTIRGIERSEQGARAEAGGECILEIDTPGPLLDGAIELGCSEACDAVRVDAWVRGAWQPVRWTERPVGTRLSLRRALVDASGERVRLRFERAVELPRLELSVLAQRALRSLPRFRSGSNPVGLTGSSPDDTIQVRLGLAPPRRSCQDPKPASPVSDARLALEELETLRWVGDVDAEVDLQVSASEDFERPVAPNLDRRVRGTELSLSDADRSFFKGGLHFWRVRRAGGPGRMPGPWSEAARFSVRTESVYVRDVNRRLDTGAGHATLGAKHLDDGWFEESGRETVEWLEAQGVGPAARCVELGCGSLRVGRWLIEYLEPEGYVGLDVVDRYYRAGLETLPPGLVDEKRPAFAEIGSTEAAAATETGFDILVSTGVVMHIPESELDAYFETVAPLLRPDGVAYISFKETEEPRQTGPMTWSHSQKVVLEQAAACGLVGEVIRSPEIEARAGYAEGIRLGVMRLHRAS